MFEPYCYLCLGSKDLSIKANRKHTATYICKPCRNQQSKSYRDRYYMPPKKTKEIGWSEDWLLKAQESQERISKRGVNYGV